MREVGNDQSEVAQDVPNYPAMGLLGEFATEYRPRKLNVNSLLQQSSSYNHRLQHLMLANPENPQILKS